MTYIDIQYLTSNYLHFGKKITMTFKVDSKIFFILKTNNVAKCAI